jgi:hypothetical protein
MALTQLANVFWEPTLTADVRISALDQLRTYWFLVPFCAAWSVGATLAQYFFTQHVLLLPIFAVPCLLAGWRIGRGWGTFFAWLAAVAGPLVVILREPSSATLAETFWNILMRFITLQMMVFLADRIHRHEDFFDELTAPRRRRADFRRHWAIFVFSIICFVVIAAGDLWTGPRLSFLPFYLVPAILVTLFLNLGWGAFTALLGAFVTSWDEYESHFENSLVKSFGWNFPMRFLMLFAVVALLNRLRHDNVLFGSRAAGEETSSDAAVLTQAGGDR